MSDLLAAKGLPPFPGPIAILPSRLKLATFFGPIAAPMVIVGTALVLMLDMFAGRLVGCICIGFGMLLFAVPMLRGAYSLVLDADGFAVTQLFWTWPYRWDQVGEFRLIQDFPALSIVFARRPRSIFEFVGIGGGAMGNFPRIFDLPASELVPLLNWWRQAAIANKAPPPRRSPSGSLQQRALMVGPS